MSRVFLDTNIVAHQFDAGEPAKQAAARRLLMDPDADLVVSTQVLLELFVVLTRKLQPPLDAATARRALAVLARLPVVPADAQLVLRAADTAARHQLSVWDAMIIEAAAEAGCPIVWTEDMPTGATIRGVEIVNPLA